MLRFSTFKNACVKFYIKRNWLEEVDARFDIVAIVEGGGERKLEVIRNAF